MVFGGLKMREILFRGKRTGDFRNGKWAYGNLEWHIGYDRKMNDNEPNSVRILSIPNDFGVVEASDVDQKTIGEYTGLQDKNDTPIYEGDIIQCVANGKSYTDEELLQHGISPVWYRATESPKGTIFCKGEVIWVEGESGWYIREKNSITSLGFVIKNPFSDCTVIGNIYDNPELLEN